LTDPADLRGLADLPLFALQTVLFPGGRLPLRIFEQRYMDMASACLRDGSGFGVCLIREGAEVGPAAVPEPVGCLARIVEWDMEQLGVLRVTALGGRRFRVLSHRSQPDRLLRASVELLAEEEDAAVPPELQACAQLLARAIEQMPAHFPEPRRLDSCAWVGARLAEALPLPLPTKQKLLEMSDARERLALLNGLLQHPG
jgi:Lon protease-like protein